MGICIAYVAYNRPTCRHMGVVVPIMPTPSMRMLVRRVFKYVYKKKLSNQAEQEKVIFPLLFF